MPRINNANATATKYVNHLKKSNNSVEGIKVSITIANCVDGPVASNIPSSYLVNQTGQHKQIPFGNQKE